MRLFSFAFTLAVSRACKVQKDVVVGYQQDLTSGPGTTTDACCEACNKNKECVAWTLHEKKCYLKNGASKIKHETGAQSGMRDGTLPPTPKPTPGKPRC